MDVRGSTALAEGMSAGEFSLLMNRFYEVATDVLVDTDAFIDKMAGDEVMAVYIPAFAGAGHADAAVRAARRLLESAASTPDLHLPIGVGVHTGVAYFGTVSGAGGAFSDITALGDTVNLAARLASAAREGEAFISEGAYAAAGLDSALAEGRELKVKGKRKPVKVRVLSV